MQNKNNNQNIKRHDFETKSRFNAFYIIAFILICLSLYQYREIAALSEIAQVKNNISTIEANYKNLIIKNKYIASNTAYNPTLNDLSMASYNSIVSGLSKDSSKMKMAIAKDFSGICVGKSKKIKTYKNRNNETTKSLIDVVILYDSYFVVDEINC